MDAGQANTSISIISNPNGDDCTCLDDAAMEQAESSTGPMTNSNDCFTIDVGGAKRTIRRLTLLKHYQSRLWRCAIASSWDAIATLVDSYDEQTNTIFFDRTPVIGLAAIEYYRTGHFHLPPGDMCYEVLRDEMSFWMFDVKTFPCCCKARLLRRFPTFEKLFQPLPPPPDMVLVSKVSNLILQPFQAEYDPFRGAMCMGKWRRRLWHIMEEPSSSITAMVFNGISFIFICVTMVALVLGSMKEFQVVNKHNQTEFLPELETADAVSVGWFTFEYLSRLLIAVERWSFVSSPLAIIDFLAIAPFYVELVCKQIEIQFPSALEISFRLVRILRVMRVLRVLRILKMARYSRGVQTFGKTIRRSWPQLSMMMLTLLICNLVFSTVIYFIECDEQDTKFLSIPAASWWCIVTMTTVGYGDITPMTVPGRIVGSLATLLGIFIVASPLSSLTQNFDNEASQQQAHTINQATPGTPGDSTRRHSTRRRSSVRDRVNSVLNRQQSSVQNHQDAVTVTTPLSNTGKSTDPSPDRKVSRPMMWGGRRNKSSRWTDLSSW